MYLFVASERQYYVNRRWSERQQMKPAVVPPLKYGFGDTELLHQLKFGISEAA